MNNDTYSKAGVDIDKGNVFVSKIKLLVQQQNRRKEVIGDIGGFGALFSFDTRKYNNPVLVSATDGVGTKMMIAQVMNKHDTIGQDLVAMCVNDILCHGAEPLFFLDYFATGKLEIKAAYEVIVSIAKACDEANVSLIGGETAEMPAMYKKDEYDLAGFCVGVVEKEKILPTKNIEAGDVLIGLESNGIHANGFSLVRKILSDTNIKLTELSPWGNKSWGEVLLEPTQIYVKPILSVTNLIKGVAHITGGGISENILRILPDDLDFCLEYKNWPEIFLWLQDGGNLTKKEMLRVFNCGIGAVIITKENKADKVMKKLNQCYDCHAKYLGYIIKK